MSRTGAIIWMILMLMVGAMWAYLNIWRWYTLPIADATFASYGQQLTGDGVDIYAPENSPVQAACTSRVISISQEGKYYKVVMASKGGFVHSYYPVKNVCVHRGQELRIWDQIGELPRVDGKNYLHYSVHAITGTVCNPIFFFNQAFL